jgi:hypothetical protein
MSRTNVWLDENGLAFFLVYYSPFPLLLRLANRSNLLSIATAEKKHYVSLAIYQ